MVRLCGVAAWALIVGVSPAGAEQVPRDVLTWGFCQVGGTHRGAEFPLSREELMTLRDELHINTLRFFVHPGFIGLPQTTWNGPESIDYTRFAEADYVWHDPTPAVDSLDEVLDLLRELSIHPVLLVFPVDEYVAYIGRDEMTFLNDATKGLDYTGIRPVDQVRTLTATLARHVHQTYGDDFTLIYTEVAGQGDGAPGRTKDRDHWAEVVAAAKSEAPGAVVCSPELCTSMWWWAAALEGRRLGIQGPPWLSDEIPYAGDWPRGDRLENYRDVFDLMAVSYYGFDANSMEWKDVAANRPALSAAAEAGLWLARTHARPRRWLWAEAGWGAPVKDRPPFHLERDLATLLFGMDHCAGALLWQAKDNEGSTAGVFTSGGERAATFDLLRAASDVVLADAAFFAADHAKANADGFPVAGDGFAEADPAVLTRFTGHHVLLFSEAPVETSVTLSQTGGATLAEIPVGHGYSSPWPLEVTGEADGRITLRRIRPGLLYVLRADR